MTAEPTPAAYGGVDNLEVMAEARNYNAFLAALVRRHAVPGASILDFGAGAGTFAAPLAAAGHDVRCIEPDRVLRDRLRHLGLAADEGLDAVAPASIDYAYSLNVLEHIEDDVAALRDLRVRLKPSGLFFLYVPAFPILYSSMDRKVGHFRRYRKALLVSRLDKAGFTVDEAAYCDSLGFLASLLFKAIGNDTGDLDRRALVAYDRLVFPLSRALDRLCRKFFGKNLLVVARRS